MTAKIETQSQTNLPNLGGERVMVINDPSQAHSAFDPEGVAVWCDSAEQPAFTNSGFCQFCGSKEHAAL